jgi:phenylpropionate dioxygenase-like ring-hydroxylating dioxygenase large terminal subunit
VTVDVPTWRPRPTLAGTDYTSEPVYLEERERIWFDRWVCIGRAEEIPAPGDYLVRDLAGESVVVTRNPDGALRAFYNVCAHRGT